MYAPKPALKARRGERRLKRTSISTTPLPLELLYYNITLFNTNTNMASIKLQSSELMTFENAAAGHEGVLSDPSGTMVIKPCTAAEVAFYESARSSHPAFAASMPTFMGTLSLSAHSDAVARETTVVSDIVLDAKAVSAQTDVRIDHHGDSQTPTVIGGAAGGGGGGGGGGAAGGQGHALDTDLAIVLSNETAGFVRPNILDIKLGSQLWDESAPATKRARLDRGAAETTSSSLGFRIAGMKVWQGEELGYKVYDKMYGRRFSAEDVVQGFKDFLVVESAGVDEELGRVLARRLVEDVKGVREVLENEESRMYSASLLVVFEGDGEVLRRALESEKEREKVGRGKEGEKGDEDEDEDDEDEEQGLKVHAVKLIDFAHASWTPGQGPDENALNGVRNVERILHDLAP
ncbi:MAG: hypothetical protein M1816_003594 [Peltula sp. TS41687]|nr:MAG: hypothetical protein M1816_003594 [Peltula sp. TS41687]